MDALESMEQLSEYQRLGIYLLPESSKSSLVLMLSPDHKSL